MFQGAPIGPALSDNQYFFPFGWALGTGVAVGVSFCNCRLTGNTA